MPGKDLLTTRLDLVDTVMLKARPRACSERGSKKIVNLPASSAPMLWTSSYPSSSSELVSLGSARQTGECDNRRAKGDVMHLPRSLFIFFVPRVVSSFAQRPSSLDRTRSNRMILPAVNRSRYLESRSRGLFSRKLRCRNFSSNKKENYEGYWISRHAKRIILLSYDFFSFYDPNYDFLFYYMPYFDIRRDVRDIKTTKGKTKSSREKWR